jgi:acetate kinase
VTRILVVNAGSSSLKLQVVGGEGSDAAHVEGWDGVDVSPISALVSSSGPVSAVGHRVVHGGPELQEPVLIDDSVRDRIVGLVSLAPLHQPRSVAGIDAARRALPDVPHVACFDTAYHATLPASASTYALPAEWRSRWPVRRFGFHGLSHAYAARRAAALLDRLDDPSLRLVTCHLGAGASLCASLGGRSVDTTMGFTPLEGLVMATRSGSVDPGLVLWLITTAGLGADEVSSALNHESGLAGLAGTPDMREVVSRAASGDAASQLALDVYIHRLTAAIAAMTASLGGLDALVFTGGVGENAPTIRAAAITRLAFLGLSLDPTLNTTATPDTLLGPRVALVTAREDLEIATQTTTKLGLNPPP